MRKLSVPFNKMYLSIQFQPGDDVHIVIGINEQHFLEMFKSNYHNNLLIEDMSVILLQRWPYNFILN